MNDTATLIREARAALRTLEIELSKVEYLSTAGLPQVAALQEDLYRHAEGLAAGLTALAKARFEVKGVYVPVEH